MSLTEVGAKNNVDVDGVQLHQRVRRNGWDGRTLATCEDRFHLVRGHCGSIKTYQILELDEDTELEKLQAIL